MMTGGTVAPVRAERRRRVELPTLERGDATLVFARRRRRVQPIGGAAAGEDGVGHHRVEPLVPLLKK